MSKLISIEKKTAEVIFILSLEHDSLHQIKNLAVGEIEP
jgi:hypothetical protein